MGRIALASFRPARIAGSLLLACLPMTGSAQTPAQWREQQIEASGKSERIMNEADKHKGLLAQYEVMRYAYAADKKPAFRLIFGQYLSWYQTFIGDYPDAAASFSIRQPLQSDDSPSPMDDPSYTARPALDAIPELAKNFRIVYLNEAHNVPLTRTITVQLLGRLRNEGFTDLAVETLYQTDTQLQARGYPIPESGFYTQEPISAELVRTALKLGLRVTAYEAVSESTGDAREAEQARNIYASTFKKNPQARLIVEAGYAHIQKSGAFLRGQSMAEHLYKLSGIDGLAIEQTMMIPHPSNDEDHPYYTAINRKLLPKTPVIFLDSNNKPWSLRKGYDVSVIFPQQSYRRERPTWLTLGDLRHPYFFSGDRCKENYPCLVEARYSDEGKNAIPADRMVLDPLPLTPSVGDRIRQGQGSPASDLYLRPGKYDITAGGKDGQIFYSQSITIPESPLPDSPEVVPAKLGSTEHTQTKVTPFDGRPQLQNVSDSNVSPQIH
jgi:hypothetical protein